MRTTYTAAVEVATKRALEVEQLTLALADYRPAVAISPRGWVEVRISVPATSLAQACITALAVAAAATGAEAIICEVKTERESEQRDGLIPEPRRRPRYSDACVAEEPRP